MYSQFAPMSSQTVRFAKDYRAEQIRTAEQSRQAAQFRTERHGHRRFHELHRTVIAHLRRHRPAVTIDSTTRVTTH